MLTKLKAYSGWHTAPTLPFSDDGRAETDLIAIRDIKGLDPVKASVNTSPLGSVDGSSYVGSTVETRNIVLTLGPQPDWGAWSYEGLRQLIYKYFMPKRNVRLVFTSEELGDVEIYGHVESVDANMFSKDPEYVISIICEDPYFTGVNPVVITGQSIQAGGVPTVVNYNGTVETGIYVQLAATADPAPTSITVQVGDPLINYFTVAASVSATQYFEMNAVPTQKYVRNVSLTDGIFTNLLSKVTLPEGAPWPSLESGANNFSVITNVGHHNWTLRYFERFGGL